MWFKYFKYVEYHSDEWMRLVSQGWVTHIVEELPNPIGIRLAHMRWGTA